MKLLQVNLSFVSIPALEEAEPIGGLTARVTDSEISTPVSISLLETGENLIRSGVVALGDAGVLNFWTPYPRDIRVQVFNIANELVFEQRIGKVFQAPDLAVVLL